MCFILSNVGNDIFADKKEVSNPIPPQVAQPQVASKVPTASANICASLRRSNPLYPLNQRQQYFINILATLQECKSLEDVSRLYPDDASISYDIKFNVPQLTRTTKIDKTACELLHKELGLHDLQPVHIRGDGNCLPRSGSYLACGDDDLMHVEMRCRMVIELARHKHLYTSNNFVGKKDCSEDIVSFYTSYSGFYDDKMSTHEVFTREVLGITKINSWMGIWGVHALASISKQNVWSIYPGNGAPRRHLERLISPRETDTNVCDRELKVMWTNTTNTNVEDWWQPNHFVAVLPNM